MSRFMLVVLVILTIASTYSLQSQEQESETATARFKERVAVWKNNLKELRDLLEEFDIAEEDKLPEIRQKFNEIVAKTDLMMPELRDLGVAAYKESPNSDRDLTRFLVKMAADYQKKDEYDSVSRITNALIEGNADDRKIWNLAGISAFIQHDFASARKYLSEAESLGSIEKPGTDYLAAIDNVTKLWEEEQKIRKAESEADDLPRVKLTTTKGDITLELFENEAPETVGNFVSLVEKGFYDGLTFHRVLPGFMAQTGCPEGDGSGGPGYRIYCEAYQDNARNHWTGSLSMAKGNQRDSGGSQFFITVAPTLHLNGVHTVFGRVIEGHEVVSKIKRRDPSDPQAAKIDPDRIQKAELLRKRDHEYLPNKVK